MNTPVTPTTPPEVSRSLQELAEKYQADKIINHSYLPIYEEYLTQRRSDSLALLEIGILDGGSLKMWRDYFPKATVQGIDLKLPYGHPPPGIAMEVCSQDDRERLEKLFPDDETFDVIIDDGSHFLHHQLTTCIYLWRLLKPGGYYFIEDVQGENLIRYFEELPGYWDTYEGDLRFDDILVVLRKT